MTYLEALKTAENLLEKVCARGEENWYRLGESKKLIRSVREGIEKQIAQDAAKAKKEEKKDAPTDAVRG